MAAELDIHHSSAGIEDELADALTFLLVPRDSSIRSAARESPLASAIAFCNLCEFYR